MRINHLVIEVGWDAAHFLPKYPGKCSHLHGHRWSLEVKVSGPFNESTGFIIDFNQLKGIVQEQVVDVYDHQLINDFIENPTAENIVEDIAKRLKTSFNKKALPIFLEELRLWETPTSSCVWKP